MTALPLYLNDSPEEIRNERQRRIRNAFYQMMLDDEAWKRIERAGEEKTLFKPDPEYVYSDWVNPVMRQAAFQEPFLALQLYVELREYIIRMLHEQPIGRQIEQKIDREIQEEMQRNGKLEEEKE